MRIYVSTAEKRPEIAVAPVGQLLTSLGTIHAGLRFSLDPAYGDSELDRLLRRVNSDFFDRLSPAVGPPGEPRPPNALGALERRGFAALQGEAWLRTTPEELVIVNELLGAWADGDAFVLGSVQAGSLEMQGVLSRDLDAVSRAIARVMRRIGRLLPRLWRVEAIPSREIGSDIASTVRDVIPDASSLAESPTGRASLGLLVSGMTGSTLALGRLGATAIDVDEGDSFIPESARTPVPRPV